MGSHWIIEGRIVLELGLRIWVGNPSPPPIFWEGIWFSRGISVCTNIKSHTFSQQVSLTGVGYSYIFKTCWISKRCWKGAFQLPNVNAGEESITTIVRFASHFWDKIVVYCRVLYQVVLGLDGTHSLILSSYYIF